MADLTPEPLDGGLVTSRDPATLSPGELTLANNAVYHPDDPAIHKVKGRTKFNAVALGAAGNVKGLRYLEFDDATAILAALEDDDIRLSVFSAVTGTFGSLAPITSAGNGASMDSVQYGNKHFLLIGAGTNQVVKANAATRRHGMVPVPELTTAPTQIAGSWSSQLGTGYYHFLVTEVAIDTITGEELESAFTGTPMSVNITNVSSQQARVTRPTVSNSGLATHWRVYMAGPTVTETPIPLLSDFRFTSEQDISNTTVDIGNQALIAGRLPTARTTQVVGWATQANVFSNTDNAGMTTATSTASEYLHTFGFSGVSGTITGFEVAVRLKMTGFTPKFFAGSNSPILTLDLTHNGTNWFPGSNATYILARQIQGITSGYVTVLMGDPYNLWGRSSWALADLNANAAFGIRLTYGEEYAGTNATLDVDWVKVAVHSTGTARPVNLEGRPYRVVTVAEAGIVTIYPADMPPPTASTGDIFEGQFLLNDITDPSMLRASLPDEVESFPGPYFVNFETKERDEITLVRRVGNKCVVGMTHQLYRLNYFPRESDAEFDRGRCFEAISESHGIVGPMAATLFSPDGGPLMLAYVAHDGLHATDAYQTKFLNGDIDWSGTFLAASLESAVLVNYPILEQLWLYYYAVGGGNKAMVYHYNSQHRREDGTFKATGPIDVAAFSSCLARLAGADVLLTGQSGGFVYVEDSGYTHNAGGTIPFSVQTREMYPGGYGGQITMNSSYIRHMADSPVGTITVTPTTRNGSSAQVAQTAKTFTNTNGGVAMLPWAHLFASLQMKLTEPGANGGGAVRITALALELTGHGLPESRT